MANILLFGTHGQKNYGDELLLKVFVHNLSPSVNTFYINSYLPELTKEFLHDFNVKVFNTKKERHKLLYYITKCDAAVFAGGSILKELYTAYKGNRYATLNMINLLTSTMSFLDKPLYFCNIGIGPLATQKGLKITKDILQRATSVTVRDSESLKILLSLLPYKQDKLASDAVFSIDHEFLNLAQPKKTRQ